MMEEICICGHPESTHVDEPVQQWIDCTVCGCECFDELSNHPEDTQQVM